MNVMNISLESIDEDHEQPRYNFNEESLSELAASIKEVGLLNPIKVQTLENGRYKIIFGNRRFKSCQILGLTEIPAIISTSDSELDIYFEQLTENIQRESFSPVEEADAFERLLNDSKFKISKTMLSSKLGKNERYISRKMDLLSFGKKVQQLIHSSNDILPNKLSEDQVLPLKNIDIEYRDILAFKVAEEQSPVKDVKRISELFLAKDISSISKEILLSKTTSQLLNDWTDYNNQKNEQKTKVELRTVQPGEVDVINNALRNSTYNQIDVVRKLHALLNNVTSHHELSEDIINSLELIKINEKEEFLTTVDGLIDCLKGHLKEWEKVRLKANQQRFSVVKRG